jgi:uncharacterized RDD family membrane protein YckC
MVERVLDVRTAEAIAVRYDLAGVGSRFLALTLDLVIQGLIAVAVYVAVAVASAPVLALGGGGLAKFWTAFALSLLALATFALFFGYFIAFELLFDGQTPGKRALGIRVVRDGGFPVDAGASILRNVIRIVEMALGFYVVSAFVMLVSPENKRAGDYAAGTIVVRDSVEAIPTLALLAREGTQTDDGLEQADRTLIDAFLARRAGLEPAAAAEIAARIAARVRPKLRASFHYLDDAALLEHLARSTG